jgi:hypothetical protein
MVFECVNKTKSRSEKWTGRITAFKNYGTHYEIKIESRSGILVLFGKTAQGAFACMPDFGVGCHLVSPRDMFWNTERLVRVLGKVDGITVATALNALSDKISY